jgi:nitrogen fixation/metabolism regulation signal transduction histidine kinase
MATTASQPAQASRKQRSIRNYLLDPGFQLKYTGYLVFIAVVLSVALGLLLWRTSDAVLAQSRTSVAQGMETVRRGQELVKTSQDLSRVVQMSIAEKYADEPDTAALFNKGADEKAREMAAEQQRLEAESARLSQQAADVEHHQQTIMLTLVLALSLLVVFIGCAGIVITHKIAGPIFKMKRQMRDLGAGHLKMPGGLRKGDELVDFFATFEDTVRSLRTRQESEIRKLDAAIAEVEAAAASSAALKSLRALRDDMQAELE